MDAHVVEDQGAPLQAVGQHVDRGLVPGNQLAIDPDQPVDTVGCRLGHAGKVSRPRGRSRSGLKSEKEASDLPLNRPPGPLPIVRSSIVKTAIHKVTEVILVTADLYRELTLSALRLLPGRN